MEDGEGLFIGTARIYLAALHDIGRAVIYHETQPLPYLNSDGTD